MKSHKTPVKNLLVALTATSLTLGLANGTRAQSLVADVDPLDAVVSGPAIMLGVDDFGQLNIDGAPFGVGPSLGGTRTVGLRYLPTGAEATAPGCLCEGWGVADAGTGVTGFANNSSGTSSNLSLMMPFSEPVPGVEALTTVIVDDPDGNPYFKVTHHYRPVEGTDLLYEDYVTIENVSGAKVDDLRFRRVMDWDIEPTAFSEIVTIQGTEDTSSVLFASNNGFASSNPLSPGGDRGATGDFVDFGPRDHGALFDFGFGHLEDGDTFSFSTYYGAAPTEEEALDVLDFIGADVYSLGQTATGGVTGAPNTFIFAFTGVDPSKVPEPSSVLALLAFGAFGAGSVLKRKN